jgi:hypothetical protein
MHWLLLLAILSSTTSLKNGGSTTSLNRLAENSLRQQLGGGSAVQNVRVNIKPGKGGRGDFDVFDVSLDGFSADRLANLSNKTQSGNSSQNDNRSQNNGYFPDDANSQDDSSWPDNGSVWPDNNPRGDNRNGDNRNDDNSNNNDIVLGYGNWSSSHASSTRLSADDFGLGDILKDGKINGAIGDILGLSQGGRIGKITLHATNFSFGGARYDSLQANLGEVRFDWLKALRGNFDIRSIQPGTLGLQLRADQAARLLAPRLPSIQNLSVRFSNGRALIGGKSNLYGLRVPFEVGARLNVSANRVNAQDFSASVSKLRLPSFVLDELTRGVNPLYDFDPKNKWPLTVNLQTAGTPNNALSLRGGLNWRGFGRNNRSSSTR